jgi:hypothetical protein
MESRGESVAITPHDAALLDWKGRPRNAYGESLAQWLCAKLEKSDEWAWAQDNLFRDAIVITGLERDLLHLGTRILGTSVEQLISAWAQSKSPSETTTRGALGDVVPLTGDASDKAAELLDLAETLAEESLAAARDQLGGFPAGDEAERSLRDIFRKLRQQLKLPGAQPA